MIQSSLSSVLDALRPLMEQKAPVLAAIDGRCASGKTTLAGQLQQTLNCPVVHMDHFFLRPEQRTPQRYQEPGGNVDRERFLEEVLRPLSLGQPVSYRPFLCHSRRLGEPLEIAPNGLVIVEGSYSCHPELFPFYDLTIFLTLSPEAQRTRILSRESAEKAELFRTTWIPLEERYFSAFHIPQHCQLCLDTASSNVLNII